jgi:uncharacterized protein DUF2017
VAGRGPVRRTRRGEFELRLNSQERDVLRSLPGQLRDLLEREDPSSDEAVARLYPPAYVDDPVQNLEYEMVAGDELTKQRFAAIATMDRTIESDRLSEDELLAWLGVMNDLRLVLGTRLDVTEETTEADFSRDDTRAASFALYVYLTWLVDAIVGALSGQTEIGPPPADESV